MQARSTIVNAYLLLRPFLLHLIFRIRGSKRRNMLRLDFEVLALGLVIIETWDVRRGHVITGRVLMRIELAQISDIVSLFCA